MEKQITKKTLGIIFLCLCGFLLNGYIYSDSLATPNLSEKEIEEVNDAINEISQSPGEVNNKIINTSKKFNLWQQVFSGIMNRDTIMNYLVFVIKFLSQLGLIVGAFFIIYAGYQYMTAVFFNNKPNSDVIKNAIIGILIVIFSYAIIRTFTSLAGLS